MDSLATSLYKEQIKWELTISISLHLLLILIIILLGYPIKFNTDKKELFLPVYNVNLIKNFEYTPPISTLTPINTASNYINTQPNLKIFNQESKIKNKSISKVEQQNKETTTNNNKQYEKNKFKRTDIVNPLLEENISKQLNKRFKDIQNNVSDQRWLENVINNLKKDVTNIKNNSIIKNSNSTLVTNKDTSQFSTQDQNYLTELWKRIQRNWTLSEVLVPKSKGLVAILMLRIRKDGSLERNWIEQSSGNERYDQSAILAINKTAPFPAPPTNNSTTYYEIGIRFRTETDLN